jgi:hypothetical protein
MFRLLRKTLKARGTKFRLFKNTKKSTKVVGILPMLCLLHFEKKYLQLVEHGVLPNKNTIYGVKKFNGYKIITN